MPADIHRTMLVMPSVDRRVKVVLHSLPAGSTEHTPSYARGVRIRDGGDVKRTTDQPCARRLLLVRDTRRAHCIMVGELAELTWGGGTHTLETRRRLCTDTPWSHGVPRSSFLATAQWLGCCRKRYCISADLSKQPHSLVSDHC
jgi:hypothetical protein